MGGPRPARDGLSVTTPRFPGIVAVADGSEAIAHVETRIAEGACAYPITPSTTMAALFQAAVADGATNLWGTKLRFIEPESEHSSASAAEGFALAGGRVTNFTAGQGLILMKEVLYVIAGKRLPVVFHVGARALTSQALNIHAGHDDVMGVADVGWGILFARNAQEATDLTAIARRTAEETEIPFIVAQDGFLTTHTFENVKLPEDELLREFVGDPRERVRSYFDPKDALMTGVVQNQDAYMSGRIGQRAFYHRLAEELRLSMHGWTELTADGGRIPRVFSVSAGLGSRDVAAGDLAAAFRWIEAPAASDRRFAVLGVRHPLALERMPLEIRPKGAFSMRGHSIGGFGSVTTNKLLAALVGDLFGLYVQAYPRYGSEKKGLPTTYFLTIAEEPIRAHAELERVDFVPLHDIAAFGQGDPLRGLVDGGAVFVQSAIADPVTIWTAVPARARAKMVERGIRLYALDTAGLARAHAPRPDLLVRMQGIALVGVFLRVAPFGERAGLDRERLLEAARASLGRFFGKRGSSVVEANMEVVRAAYDGVIDVTAAVATPVRQIAEVAT